MKTTILVLLASALAYAQTDIGGRNFKGRLDATAAPSTAPIKSGLLSARPSACTRADQYFSTDATPGSNISLCTTTGAPGTWSVISAGGIALTDLFATSPISYNNLTGTFSHVASAATIIPCGDTTHSCRLTFDPSGHVSAIVNDAIAGVGAGITSPGTSTDRAVLTCNGTGCSAARNSNVTIDASDNVSTPGGVTAISMTLNSAWTGAYSLQAGTGNMPALPANSAGWAGPVTGGTAYLFKPPATITAGLLQVATPSVVDNVNQSVVTSTTAPTISSFANANHTHANSAGGGALALGTAIPNLSGDVITSGSSAVTIAANAVTSAKQAVVNTRRTFCIPFGSKNASAVLADTDLADSALFEVNAPSTVVQITVRADAGTPNITLGRDRAGSVVNLTSSALATAASGGIACSKTSAVAGLNGVTTCSATLQNVSLNAGDWIVPVSGTAGGTAKQLTVCLVMTVD